jgi:hypothetical protein
MIAVAELQESFVRYLPHLRRNARLAFHNLDGDKKEEAVSNVIGLCWKHWHRLNERDKANEAGMLKAICWFAIKQTKAGRRIDSAGKPRDPLSLRMYGRVKFEPFDLNELVGKNTNIPDAVSFRLDVPAFFTEVLTERQRNLAFDLAVGMSTTEAAAKYNRTPGAISQFRTRFKLLFDRFFNE